MKYIIIHNNDVIGNIISTYINPTIPPVCAIYIIIEAGNKNNDVLFFILKFNNYLYLIL